MAIFKAEAGSTTSLPIDFFAENLVSLYFYHRSSINIELTGFSETYIDLSGSEWTVRYTFAPGFFIDYDHLSNSTGTLTGFSITNNRTSFLVYSVTGSWDYSEIFNNPYWKEVVFSGSDMLSGGVGDDIILGYNGNDTIQGNSGDDSMYGGEGNDTYYVDSTNDYIVEESTDIDTVYSTVTYTLPRHVEELVLTGFSAIDGKGNYENNILIGNVLANTLDGYDGDDTMQGGAGDDTYIVDSKSDEVIEGSDAGSDLVASYVSYSLSSNVENLSLRGSSKINGTGNELANTITGNSQRNTLSGGAGNDILTGNDGNDKLIGGAGSDSFQFLKLNSGVDTIDDFETGIDKIVIDSAGFGITSCSLLSSDTNLPAPTEAKPYLLYNYNNGELWFDKDGTGSSAAVQIADLSFSFLSNTRKLMASDIILTKDAQTLSISDWVGTEDKTNNLRNEASTDWPSGVSYKNAINAAPTFRVFLSSTATSDVTFTAKLEYSSATAADVNGLSTTGQPFTIRSGQSFIDITLSSLADYEEESPEAFKVTLSNVVGATVAKGIGTGILINNDIRSSAVVELVTGEENDNYIDYLATASDQGSGKLRYEGGGIPAGAIHSGFDVNRNSGPALENDLTFPIVGKIVNIYGQEKENGGGIVIELPSTYGNGDDRFILYHNTSTDLKIGQLINIGDVAGDFNPTTFVPHAHLESNTNSTNKVSGWIYSPSPELQDPRIPIAISDSYRHIEDIAGIGGNTSDQATPIGFVSEGKVKETYSTIGGTDLVDWYSFQVDITGPVSAMLSWNSANRAVPNLTIFRSDGTTVISNNLSGLGNIGAGPFTNSELTSTQFYASLSAGNYLIRIDSANSPDEIFYCLSINPDNEVTINGNDQDNFIVGHGGGDNLVGGGGADTICGSWGKDTLIGGVGSDVFDFNTLSEIGNTSSTWDVIMDFSRGQDKIDLSTLDANTATTTNEAFNGTLIASTASFTTAGQLKFVSGVLYGNTDADSTAEFTIQLNGITALSASDFIL